MSLKKNILLDFILNGIQVAVRHRNKTAKETLQQQIEQIACKSEITHSIKDYTQLDKTSLPLQGHTLKSAMILCFYWDDKNGSRIKGLKSVTGNELAEEKRNTDGIKELHIWNEKTKQRDVYEEVFSSRDHMTGSQFSAYFDKTNQRLTFNFGGTDFTNINDFKSAVQTMTGSVDMRMTQVQGNIASAMAMFNEKYPGLAKDIPVDIVGHSSGVNAVPMANYCLRREYGIEPRSQVMFDPFGMKNSFGQVANMIAKAEGRDPDQVLKELSHNTMSYKVKNQTFIDKLNYLDPYNHNGPATVEATIGPMEYLKVQGNLLTAHMGKAWIMHFNAMEMEQIDPSFLASDNSFEMTKAALKAQKRA